MSKNLRKYFWNLKNCANICTNKSQKIIMPQMFSQLFVQIFALYNFFRQNLRKKGANFLWILYGQKPWTDFVSCNLNKIFVERNVFWTYPESHVGCIGPHCIFVWLLPPTESPTMGPSALHIPPATYSYPPIHPSPSSPHPTLNLCLCSYTQCFDKHMFFVVETLGKQYLWKGQGNRQYICF